MANRPRNLAGQYMAGDDKDQCAKEGSDGVFLREAAEQVAGGDLKKGIATPMRARLNTTSSAELTATVEAARHRERCLRELETLENEFNDTSRRLFGAGGSKKNETEDDKGTKYRGRGDSVRLIMEEFGEEVDGPSGTDSL